MPLLNGCLICLLFCRPKHLNASLISSGFLNSLIFRRLRPSSFLKYQYSILRHLKFNIFIINLTPFPPISLLINYEFYFKAALLAILSQTATTEYAYPFCQTFYILLSSWCLYMHYCNKIWKNLNRDKIF